MNSSQIDTRSKIEAAILRIIPEHRLPLVVHLLPSAVHALLVEGGDVPRSRKRPDKAGMAKELDKVADAAQALLDALNGLHSESAKCFQDVFQLAQQVRIINLIASGSSSALKEGNDSPFSKPATARTGLRPPERLALSAACVFWQMTDEEPSRINRPPSVSGSAHTYLSGPYIEFLKEVFAARRVDASPDSCAKEALKTLKSDYGIKPKKIAN